MRALTATFALLAALLVGCGDDLAPAVDVSGTWHYDWQVRDNGEPYPDWDGHFRGELVLQQNGADVMGTIGYPVEDPATLFGDPTLRDAWQWPVYGVLADDGLHLFAPPPNTSWDDGWKWHLTVGATEMSGPSWAGAQLDEKWPFKATR